MPEPQPEAQPAPEPDYTATPLGMTDADLRRTLLASVRLLVVFAVVAAGLFWWRTGWQSALLVLSGAVISALSLWEWMRLMSVIAERMDAGHKPHPMGMILFGFFGRLALVPLVVYANLRYLHGTFFALAAGFGVGLLALVAEALLLMNKRPN